MASVTNSSDHRGEISIGEGKWIPFFDLEGRYQSAVAIDATLRPLARMWDALETQCVAGCCGIEAFDFWPTNIAKAAKILDATLLLSGLTSIRDEIEKLEADVFESRRLNSYFDKRQLLMLLDHLAQGFDASGGA
jgi:Family of unknown function (DUF6331)